MINSHTMEELSIADLMSALQTTQQKSSVVRWLSYMPCHSPHDMYYLMHYLSAAYHPTV